MPRNNVSSQKLTRILELYDNKIAINKIAKEVDLAWGTVASILKANGKEETNYSKRIGLQMDSSGYLGNRVAGTWTREHRVKAEKALGRPLKRNEIVHHINGDKTDNRNENLLICDQPYHVWLHWRMSELYQKEHFRVEQVQI